MEATPQATQRIITVESFDLLKDRRPRLLFFQQQLLVQYPLGRLPEIRQVVPDNMAILWDEPIEAEGSCYAAATDRPFLGAGICLKIQQGKDYEDNHRRYERELKVPYYLVFYPEAQELTLFRLKGRKYRAVPPNEVGRHPIVELDVEVAILDGWVPYWYRGKLLPLPAELQRELTRARMQTEPNPALAEQGGDAPRAGGERAEQAETRAEQERQEKERFGALLRSHGIEPE